MRKFAEFRFQIGQVRAASAGAGRIAGLRHEAVDHPVKDDAVIEMLARQFLDPCHMVRRQVGAQLDLDAAIFEVEIKRVFKIRGARRAGQQDCGQQHQQCAKAMGHVCLRD